MERRVGGGGRVGEERETLVYGFEVLVLVGESDCSGVTLGREWGREGREGGWVEGLGLSECVGSV